MAKINVYYGKNLKGQSRTMAPDTVKFDEGKMRARVHFATVIEQANSIEFDINDILANDHFEKTGEAFLKDDYLAYIEKYLLKNPSLDCRIKSLQELPAAKDIFEALERDGSICVVDVFNRWRKTRNAFAHGMLVESSSGQDVLYCNGYCYDIEFLTAEYLAVNAEGIHLLSSLAGLHSPYYGCPVLKDETNNPDYPLKLLVE